MNDNTGKSDFVLKILTIGESGVGKTCILLRYTDNKFVKNHLTTIGKIKINFFFIINTFSIFFLIHLLGIDYKSKNVTINNKTIKLKIWDTAGQERFRNITQQYYKNADGILLVFDVSDRSSFEKVRDWMKQIQNYTQKEQIAIVLVGNKSDVESREVYKDEGESLAKEYGVKYFETSALNNTNIEETFNHLANDIFRIKDYKEVGASSESQSKGINLGESQGGEAKKKGCC